MDISIVFMANLTIILLIFFSVGLNDHQPYFESWTLPLLASNGRSDSKLLTSFKLALNVA